MLQSTFSSSNTKQHLIILFCFCTCIARTQILTFEKVFGEAETDYGTAVVQTSDNGYAILGHSHSFGNSSWAFHVVKTDSAGNELWSKSYRQGWSADLIETNDKGLFILGQASTGVSGIGADDVYLIKTDSLGNQLWAKNYGTTKKDGGKDICKTYDGGYAICGFITTDNNDMDIFIVKIDSNGVQNWTKTYGGIENDFATSIQETSDSGFVISGIGYGGRFFLKTDVNGDSIWNKTYYFSSNFGKVKQTSDGGYIMLVNMPGTVLYCDSVSLIKINSLGDTLWARSYLCGYAIALEFTGDDGFILTGSNHVDVFLAKVNKNGNKEWINTYSSGAGYSTQQTNDRGYIIGGIKTYPYSDLDYYLIKVDSNGINHNVIFNDIEDPKVSQPPSIEVLWNASQNSLIIKHTAEDSELNFNLYDMSGRSIVKSTLISNRFGYTELTVNRDIEIGIYLYSIRGDKEILATGKISIQK